MTYSTVFGADLLRADNAPGLALAAFVGCLAGAAVVVLLRRVLDWTAQPVEAPPAPAYDPFVQGSRSERRTALRRKGAQVEVLLRADDGQTDRGTAWVVDRSMGGMCLVVEDPFTVDEVLSVRPVKAPETAPWSALHVRSCRKKAGRWEIGCQFRRQPTWNVLMLFG